MMAANFLPLDFDAKIIDEARRILADIHEVQAAEFSVRWNTGTPMLVLAFNLPETVHQAALAIRLTSMPSETVLSGDRLRRHVRNSVENYLAKHGIRLPIAE